MSPRGTCAHLRGPSRSLPQPPPGEGFLLAARSPALPALASMPSAPPAAPRPNVRSGISAGSGVGGEGVWLDRTGRGGGRSNGPDWPPGRRGASLGTGEASACAGRRKPGPLRSLQNARGRQGRSGLCPSRRLAAVPESPPCAILRPHNRKGISRPRKASQARVRPVPTRSTAAGSAPPGWLALHRIPPTVQTGRFST
ncbi:uncharacterized protein LOC115072350 [Nannospalax galili]|uniref:uncharacterized protein LOC115072350 n=1 Tax=Nannospalax galili TaxID=1026970 RepID=UPI00111C7D3D|nr:uncharacterized protein LOC115072350 [Nannospalax galili]XP_029425090.1 uncharacterized protein LOC115072350 [Nannospalax galili]XP_029425093.1 uncharacterized protein LOC115072350 [Nannospalax galili]XP_029425095.1 uncharacterized protein LOC115072350 [Nannospalax galili]XP_029425097.1 uncharacterized protein LOC115072350 [Nannospalax galili]XP_029425100.1 uncharacterized protein LOC115072350 [Nannospalax galili]XP_029425103.1 uncharacterized protein LOC115072350 [Nannospalax galili]XP_0